MQGLNEVLDNENISEYSSEDDKHNKYQWPSKLFKMYPVTQHLNNKFQNLYIPNQNIAIGFDSPFRMVAEAELSMIFHLCL
jgi:hypothetical protein